MEIRHLVQMLKEAEEAQEILFRLYYKIDLETGEFYGGNLEKGLLEELKRHFKIYRGE